MSVNCGNYFEHISIGISYVLLPVFCLVLISYQFFCHLSPKTSFPLLFILHSVGPHMRKLLPLLCVGLFGQLLFYIFCVSSFARQSTAATLIHTDTDTDKAKYKCRHSYIHTYIHTYRYYIHTHMHQLIAVTVIAQSFSCFCLQLQELPSALAKCTPCCLSLPPLSLSSLFFFTLSLSYTHV